jgi:hypothetical protein
MIFGMIAVVSLIIVLVLAKLLLRKSALIDKIQQKLMWSPIFRS